MTISADFNKDPISTAATDTSTRPSIAPEPLAQAEREQLLHNWNATQEPYPRTKCIHELFEEQVRRTPEAVALVFREQRITYKRLNEEADALASVLRRVGVGPEVPVGVCMLRSPEMVVALYAVHKAGGAYVPMDPSYPQERLAFMLEDTQAPVLLTQAAVRELLPATQAKIVCVDSLGPDSTNQGLRITTPPAVLAGNGAGSDAENTPAPCSSENLAYVIYTSGSTGKPKGVMVRHRNVVNFFTGMDIAIGTEPGVWLAVTSISFDISVLELFWTLTRGFTVVLQEDETSRLRATQKLPGNDGLYTAAEQILRYGVTHLQCTPSLARLLLQDARNREALRQVKHFLFGGEPLPPDLVQQFGPGAEILNMYGPTETTVWSTFYRVTHSGGSIPIGRPIANTTIYILDQHLQAVPVGETGELFIGGEGVTRGYWGRPELTAERFIPDPFGGRAESRLYRTGDLARYRADGTIEFLGRLDHQVKMRGYRIELGEIEAVLGQHPQVQANVVSVWEAGPDNKQLVAYFVSKEGAVVQPAELKNFLKGKLPAHMVPSVLMSLPKLPLTPNGKIDRQALPLPKAPAVNGGASRAPAPLPQDQAGILKTVPLTEAQRELWYAAQMSDAVSCSLNLSAAVSLHGPLDVSRLLRSFNWLVERHEALRVTFSPDGEAQHILRAVPVQVTEVDLSSLPPGSRQQELQRNQVAVVDEPFDLARGPLWRARLIRLAPEEHIFLLAVHHVTCDGSSLDVLLEELGERYSAEAKGESMPSQDAPAFSEFILEQEKARQSPEREATVAFWMEQYSHPAPVLALPTDRPRLAKRVFTGGSETLLLNAELVKDLKRFSSLQRCTLTTTLLAGYYLLLHALSRQSEIIVGLPTTSRSGERGERLVGHCVNFLPLRLSLKPENSFTEHLDRVREVLLKAYTYPDITLGSLLQKLNLPRGAGRMPLVSVMLNLDWALGEASFEGLEATVACNPPTRCRYDLSFSFTECQEQMLMQCQYSAELFNAETIQRWLRDYKNLLTAIVASPGQRLSELCRWATEGEPHAAPLVPEIGEALTPDTEPTPVGEPVLPAPALTSTEQALAEIWCEVIGLDKVGRQDDFFDVGGHSLLATQIISRISRVFNVELPLRTIFEVPTLGGLAEAVVQAQREQPGGATAIPRRSREAKAGELLERLEQLSEAELQKLLLNPKVKDILL